MSKSLRFSAWFSLLLLLAASLGAAAETGKQAKDALNALLLGKDVQALLDMPAFKDGIDIYYVPRENKRLDERGIDLKEMSK